MDSKSLEWVSLKFPTRHITWMSGEPLAWNPRSQPPLLHHQLYSTAQLSFPNLKILQVKTSTGLPGKFYVMFIYHRYKIKTRRGSSSKEEHHVYVHKQPYSDRKRGGTGEKHSFIVSCAWGAKNRKTWIPVRGDLGVGPTIQ
jgi:hypothetical protein